MKKILMILLISVICVKLSAQVQINYYASPALTGKGKFGLSEKIAERVLPATTGYEAPKTDSQLTHIPSDERKVDISPLIEASSEVVGNNIIYRQKIVGTDATTVKVFFDRLQLSKNAQVYIYTPSGSVITGPITANENIGKDRLWGSNRFPGSEAIIELVIPESEKSENDIHLSKITLGVDEKKISNPADPASFGHLGNADGCAMDVNVMCAGIDWEKERKAICYIETENGSASGSLISNTCNSDKPYLLTAHHVVAVGGNPNNWQFYFHWWSPTCGTIYTQTALLFNGAYFRASYVPTDFALLELATTPSINSDITYLGWSRSTTAPATSAGIHHPGGDQMRIAYSNSVANNVNIAGYLGTGWGVIYKKGTGAVQFGSSGSPLFDPNKKVVGDLWFGNPGQTNCDLRYGLYGRFDLSWTGGGTNSTRLSNWLDPTGTNDMTTNTTYVSNMISINPSTYIIDGPSQFCTSQTYSISALPASATVTWSVHEPFLSSSQTNNILTINRIDDGDATIYAVINICGETFYKQRTVRVGGAPITVSATQLSCDEFQFDVTGAATGASYNWSSNYNTILYNGTSTIATTSYPAINGTTMGGDAAIVNTTNTCNQSVYRYAQLYNIYLRNIDGILGIYSNGDQVVCSVNTTPYDTYYKWYINGYLDSEGESLSGFATYNYPPQGQGIVCGDNTIRVEVTACGGTISSDEYHFWKMGNCFGKNTPTANVELFPNPAFNQTTIRITDIKESTVKLNAIKSIKIIDKMGNFITEIKYPKNSKSITVDLHNLSIGIYFIEVSDGINKIMLPLNVLK